MSATRKTSRTPAAGAAQPVAVLTGDLVASSKMSPKVLADVRKRLRAASSKFDAAFGGVIGELAVSRGDGWQMALSEPGRGLRAALFMRASLMGSGLGDTRVSLALGFADNIAPADVGVSTGEAFTLSGRGLEAIGERMDIVRLTLPERVVGTQSWRWAMAAMQACATVAEGWKLRQADIVAARLLKPDATLEAMGKSLGITQQAVSKSLAGAQFSVAESAMTAFEAEDWTSVLKR